ncbi:MAG: glycine--tRNA ligase [Candidatus Micrarchaeia archaeon]
MQKLHERVLDIAIQRGFLIPSAEIYGAPAGFYDYGPIGTPIKRKMQNLWREIFISKNGFLEIESSTVVPHEVLVASGHATNFTDPVVICKKDKKQFRADHLLQDATQISWEGKTPHQLDEAIKSHGIKCPECKGELSAVQAFNLMFATKVGSSEKENAYLRPETAQGIFLDFKRIFMQNGSKLPFAIGQIGKSYRNEISPRQGLVRMREFTQMELEYFFNPAEDIWGGFEKIQNKKIRIKPPAEGDAQMEVDEYSLQEAIERKWVPNQIMAAMIYWQQQYYEKIGIEKGKFHFAVLPLDALPHYSKGNVDLEVETSYGTIETSGTAYRTDFDLANHSKHSKVDLSVLDPMTNQKVMPHVIEPSLGVDRPFYCILEHCFRPKSAEKEWDWFAFPTFVAPYIAGIFPLMKKDGLPEIAQEIVDELRAQGIECYYTQSGSIGKRYARADEIGVPYCITIDYDSKEKGDVTIRYRDDGGQERIKIFDLAKKLQKLSAENKTSLK